MRPSPPRQGALVGLSVEHVQTLWKEVTDMVKEQRVRLQSYSFLKPERIQLYVPEKYTTPPQFIVNLCPGLASVTMLNVRGASGYGLKTDGEVQSAFFDREDVNCVKIFSDTDLAALLVSSAGWKQNASLVRAVAGAQSPSRVPWKFTAPKAEESEQPREPQQPEPDAVRRIIDVYENQEWYSFSRQWGVPRGYSRYAWSDHTGTIERLKSELTPGLGYQWVSLLSSQQQHPIQDSDGWYVHLDPSERDEEGWQYAVTPWLGYGKQQSSFSTVRRRKDSIPNSSVSGSKYAFEKE